MLNRLTVSTLLKTVILITTTAVIAGFAWNAWTSWQELQQANRIAVIADGRISELGSGCPIWRALSAMNPGRNICAP